MKTNADHSAESHSRAFAHQLAPTPETKTSETEFIDQRPESLALAAQLKMIEGSSRVHQLMTVQRMINGGVMQRKHERKPEEEESATAQKMTADKPVQRAVKDSIPNGSRIIIDNFNASDFRSPGRIVRNSQVPGFKVVEFDDDPGVGYRVALHEMSALDAAVQREHGDPALTGASFSNGEDTVFITCTVDVTDKESQTAEFEVMDGHGRKVAFMNLANYDREDFRGFTIVDIDTKVLKVDSAPGLGTLLMKIAAEMAAKFSAPEIELAATKKPDQRHPAPFYQKWGFAPKDGKGLDESSLKTVVMTARTAAVDQSTGSYLARKNWN